MEASSESALPYSNDMSTSPANNTELRAWDWPPLPLLQGRAGQASPEVAQIKPDQRQLTNWLTEYATDFVDRHKDEPFFLYLPHAMPHVPLYASAEFRGKSAGGLYGDVVEELDASVGRVLDALKRNGLDEDTIVVFTSDNGPCKIKGDFGGSSGPVRGAKGMVDEGGRSACGAPRPRRVRAPAAPVNQEPSRRLHVEHCQCLSRRPPSGDFSVGPVVGPVGVGSPRPDARGGRGRA